MIDVHPDDGIHVLEPPQHVVLVDAQSPVAGRQPGIAVTGVRVPRRGLEAGIGGDDEVARLVDPDAIIAVFVAVPVGVQVVAPLEVRRVDGAVGLGHVRSDDVRMEAAVVAVVDAGPELERPLADEHPRGGARLLEEVRPQPSGGRAGPMPLVRYVLRIAAEHRVANAIAVGIDAVLVQVAFPHDVGAGLRVHHLDVRPHLVPNIAIDVLVRVDDDNPDLISLSHLRYAGLAVLVGREVELRIRGPGRDRPGSNEREDEACHHRPSRVHGFLPSPGLMSSSPMRSYRFRATASFAPSLEMICS